MYLNKITLTNFRLYYKKCEFYLGYDPQRNFNVIFGNNAAGKSSLLNAITWAFYGEEMHDRKKRNNPLYNKMTSRECQETGEDFKVSVKLELYDLDSSNNKKHFHVTRSRYYKIGEDGEPIMNEEKLEVLDFDGIKYENDQTKIDYNISTLMHKYFFFNGEQLENYFDNNDLKDTIDRISQLNLINKVKDHLISVEDKYSKIIGEKDDDLKPINEKITVHQGELDQYKKDRKELVTEIDLLKNEIKNFDEELKRLENAKKLVEEREKLLKEKSNLLKDLNEKEGKYDKKVIDLYVILNLFNILEKVAKLDAKLPEKSQIKNDILIELYENILRDGVCLCGADFNKFPKHKDKIESRLRTLKIDVLEDDLNGDNYLKESETISEVKSLLKTINIRHEAINDLRSDITKINKRINGKEGINERLEDISKTLKVGDEGENVKISQLEKNRISSEERLGEEEDNLKELEGKIKDLKNLLEIEKDERYEILSNKKELASLRKQLTFCGNAIKIIEDLDVNLKDDILEQIRNKIYQQFVGTDWSNGKYKDVIIDDNYNISMKDLYDDILITGDLSGGEERILALSFIIALNSISGFDLPLFIDAPLSTLDNNSSRYFLENLNNFTKDKQIIFLFIGDVYDSNIENMIEPYLNEKSELIKKEQYITEVKHYERAPNMSEGY